MVSARGMSCGGRLRFAGSELAGSGWAARRFLRSAHQVSKWSTQAWMVKLHGPSLSTVKAADQRSLPSAVIGVDCQPESLWCLQSRRAATWSWPSQKMAAETATLSPRKRRAG